MTTVVERIGMLRPLSVRKCLVFAACCAQRTVTEAQRVCPEKLAAYPQLGEAVELLWRQAIDGDVDFERDADQVHTAVTDLVPRSEDAPAPDAVIEFAGRAMSVGLGILIAPDRAAKYAANVGGAMVDLVGCVYEDDSAARAEERRWQDRAFQRLSDTDEADLRRTMFDGISEYERGPISQEYEQGLA